MKSEKTIVHAGALLDPKKSRTDFLINLAGGIVPIATAIATIPLFLEAIGETRYGVLAIVWMLVGYAGMLDLGLARATINALAKMPINNRAPRRQIFWTAIWINLSLGVGLGLLVFAFGRLLIVDVAHMQGALAGEIVAALPFLAWALPVILVGGVATAVLEAREHFATVNFIQSSGAVAVQIVPLVAAVFVGPRLDLLIALMLGVRGLTTLALFVAAARREAAGWPVAPNWARAGKLLRFGGWVSISSLVSPLLAGLDQLVIGALAGAAAVARYAVPMSMVVRSQIVALALSRLLFPKFSRGDTPPARALLLKTVALAGPGLAALYAPAMILAQPLVTLWLGAGFGPGAGFAGDAARIAEILILGAWINSLAFLPYSFVQGVGRPDLVAKFHLAEIVPYILVLSVLVYYAGITGAAIAWCLRVAGDWALLSAAASILRQSLVMLVPWVAVLLGAYGVVLADPASLVVRLGLSAAMFGLGLA
ncbi:MAG: oligosaccharide flippase family protein, partial [Alphaproteobacteria bacterium]